MKRKPEVDLAQKQRLYEEIKSELTKEQQKGIIPIVRQHQTQTDGASKFEFDLFSVPDETFMALDKYVKECIAANKAPPIVEETQQQFVQN